MKPPSALTGESRKLFVFDRSIIFLLLVYAAIFGWQIATANDIDVQALDIIGVDHASILRSMITILEKKTFFNQTAAYHSSYYGWTYFFVSFLFLAPIKFVAWAANIDTNYSVYIALKTLHFTYGAAAIITFYWLARLLFKNSYAIALTLAFMLASPLTHYLYMFHPEPIGIIFLNLAMLFLIDAAKRLDNGITLDRASYLLILSLSVLSILAKPTFLFLGGPIYLCGLALYLVPERNYQNILCRIMLLACEAVAISLAMFFLINPYFFFRLRSSIAKQIENVEVQSNSPMALTSWLHSIEAWFFLIIRDPLLSFSFLSIVLSVLYLLGSRRNKGAEITVYIFLCIVLVFDIAFIVTHFRLFISPDYLDPILPLLLISAMFVIEKTMAKVFIRPALCAVMTVAVVVFLGAPEFTKNMHDLLNYYSYRNSDTYRIYRWMDANIEPGASIIHDFLVGRISNKSILDFQYWNISENTLRTYPATYIVFSPTLTINGIIPKETSILFARVKSESYSKVAKVGAIEVYRRQPHLGLGSKP